MEDYMGIDVGAKSVVVCVRRAGRALGVRTFPQTPEGHQALIKATGVYYLDLAVRLVRAEWPVAIINPRGFHHFAQLKLSHAKTDDADSALWAE